MTPAQFPGVRWLLELEGESEELQALVKMFPPSKSVPLSVQLIQGTYYLHAPEFEEMESHKTVWVRGRILSERLTGLGRLKFGAFRRVRPASVVQPVLGGPPNRTTVVEWARLQLPTPALGAYLQYDANRPPAMNVGLQEQVSALPPTESWVTVPYRRYPELDQALYLLRLATESEDWRTLYLAYEIVEQYAGQPSWIQEQGWAQVSEIQRFKSTANSWGVLGVASRHARKKNQPPPNPMSFKEEGISDPLIPLVISRPS